MNTPPEYEPWKLGSLRRVDGARTNYCSTYWGIDGKSTIEEQVWNCHGFLGENGKTKAQTVLDWCVGSRLLEVACAPGAFLKLAREAGFECTGIEPCAEHVPFIRDYSGCTVANLMFEDFLAGPEFHTLVATDLIEHVDDPEDFVAQAMGMLKPLGRLILMTPVLGYSIPWRDCDFHPEHLHLLHEDHIKEWLKPIHMELWYPGHMLIVCEKEAA